YDFTNSLDSDTDQVDIWSAPFNKGDQIELTITADDGQDIICEIHGPGASYTLLADAESYGSPATVYYTVETAGTYYFRTWIYEGSSNYRLQYGFHNDDSFPGAIIPGESVNGLLDDATDDHDIYRLGLVPGDCVRAFTGYDLSLLSMALWGPGETSWPAAVPPIATADADGMLQYRVETAGTYSLAESIYGGATDYWIDAYVENDNNLPGIAWTSPVSNSLDQLSDSNDVYRVWVDEGQALTAQITTPDTGQDVGLYVYNESASSITDPPVATTLTGAYPRKIGLVAPSDGYYYIRASIVGGGADYTLTWDASPASSVKGKVTTTSGVALSGVGVSVAGGGSATTGADGGYSIANMLPGTRSVTFSKAGYVSQTVSVSVPSGAAATRDIALARTTGSIVGKVTYLGAPLAGVIVTLPGVASTTTGADGGYAIDGLAPGSYSASFSKDLYVAKTLPVTVVADAAAAGSTEMARVIAKSTIVKKPAASSVTYKRKKGVAKFKLSASFTGWGATPLAGRIVYLQTSKNGKTGWKNTYKLTTGATGVASKSFKVKTAKTVYYRWSIGAGAEMNFANKSSKTKVRVK
ncbi:MAG TPA: carboxypeptidase-like regulatory domain-containing protein, partial [Coriobacteriia bacterium]|nr:carboxypeptidase-like regulatory domain-containing protein [Coriobacteriia bacterium]